MGVGVGDAGAGAVGAGAVSTLSHGAFLALTAPILWLAGGGTRPGFAYGRTDELGYEAVENPMHVHDLHATILHLLGLNHERLTYRYAGRDMRLTDVKGVVHKGILA